jgi:hypothetical protein
VERAEFDRIGQLPVAHALDRRPDLFCIQAVGA